MSLSAHIRPLTDSMALAYAYDPAFDRGDDEDAYLQRFRSATERLDYSGLVKPGETPTLFHLRPLTDAETRRIRGLGDISEVQLAALVVRMCLERVENGGELSKVERATDHEFPKFGKLVSPKYMEVLAGISIALGRPQGEITNQIGIHVFMRSLNLDPK